MSHLKWSEYINTGGNCYVMFGNIETGEIGSDGVWFAGSVDATDEPIIDLYLTREDAYNCDGETGFIRRVTLEEGEWVRELWEDAFVFAIEHGSVRDATVAFNDLRAYFIPLY